VSGGPSDIRSLPDETPVEDLPLRRFTINALRLGGVLTLGELRAMGDRELMTLRNFGRVALADVRALVPVPEGGRHEGR
jgi:DNA-directed RNA polymerase alpha subunit